MNHHLAFTEKSLETIVKSAPDNWFPSPSNELGDLNSVFAFADDEVISFFHKRDRPNSQRIFIVNQGDAWPSDLEKSREIFQRLHSFTIRAQRTPVHLPRDWAEYHLNNLLGFFASPRKYGDLRWIAEVHADGSNDICFWKLTTTEEPQPLHEFRPDRRLLRKLADAFESCRPFALTWFEANFREASKQSIQDAVDLDEMSFGSVTKFRTYSDWIPELTEQQKRFVEHAIDGPVKLRGIAGSGKTLVMALKALNCLYNSRPSSLRVLYVTHSWEVAEKVTASLGLLDEHDRSSEIDVLPLLYIAQNKLPQERFGNGFELLGEDSLEGKLHQLRLIDEILTGIVKSDWLYYGSKMSPELKQRAKAEIGSPSRNALVWDLMYEFACVLSAHGIIPGINAEKKYLDLHRANWMMPLPEPADKKFVLRIYTQFVDRLKKERKLTSDQLINDFINFLETFTWNMLRENEGYDIIFVDEMHLFNDQERLAITYLTRNADVYPCIMMALDPRQSPAEVFVDFPIGEVRSRDPGTAERLMGEIDSLELSTVHRFSPQIMSLVKHINSAFPTLDLGRDWEVDLGSLRTTGNDGKKPQLRQYGDEQEEFRETLSRAADREQKTGQRTAVVVVDTTALPRIISCAEEAGPSRYSIIKSRDNLEVAVKYSKRRVVVSAAEYLSGLQFDHVYICGVTNISRGLANMGYQRRRFLSLLYLAVSRAARSVEIATNDQAGGVPDILESAVGKGVIGVGDTGGG